MLLGLPPFAMFASELAIARSLADARLAWALGIALPLVVVAFGALVKNAGRILLGPPVPGAAAIPVPATVAAALIGGVAICVLLGVTIGPLGGLFETVGDMFGVR